MNFKNASLQTQILLIVAVMGTLITTFVALLLALEQREAYYSQYASDIEITSQRIAFNLELASNDLVRDVKLLALTPSINGIIRAERNGGVDPIINAKTEDWMSVLESIFVSGGSERTAYFQIRLISADDNGKEMLRVERTGSGFVRVDDDQLQQVGNRE